MRPGRSDRVRRRRNSPETRVGFRCERECTARGGGRATLQADGDRGVEEVKEERKWRNNGRALIFWHSKYSRGKNGSWLPHSKGIRSREGPGQAEGRHHKRKSRAKARHYESVRNGKTRNEY